MRLARRWASVAVVALIWAGTTGCGGSRSGRLDGSVTGSQGTVDLSAEGTLDWAQWGYLPADADQLNEFAGNLVANDCRYDLHCFNHKAGGGGRITDFAPVGHVSPFRLFYRDATRRFTWADGTPLRAATDVRSLVYMGLVGNGFRVVVPAGTAERTLRLYSGVYQGTALCVAILSDGSAPVFRESLTTPGGGVGWNVVCTFRYRAASEGQRLTMLWLLTADQGGANVGLLAATLQ